MWHVSRSGIVVAAFVSSFASALALTLVSTALHAQEVVASQPSADRASARAAETVLSRPISIELHRVALKDAIDSVAAVGGVVVQYRLTVVSAHRAAVSVHAKKTPLRAVFAQVLQGTGLQIVPLKDARFVLVSSDDAIEGIAAGIVAGTVTGAKTKAPLRGVSVFLDDTVRATRTNDAGEFRFAAVVAGPHRVSVRSVGYARQTQLITVTDDQTLRVDFALTSSVNTLDQVVVTATGEQRIRELGHVVSRINADSLVKEAPITSMSELLQARVPGLQVLTGSGGVAGGGIALRLRGQTTANLDPEPIVIVDGVRYRSNDNIPTNGGPVAQDTRGRGELRSPLNDLNVNDIESVEVVKGPSASTLYGPDASNGVIVITTKRGKAGKTEFHWYAHPVANDIPTSRLARGYQAWGHDPTSNETVPYNCTLQLQYEYNQCVLDSLTVAPTFIEDPAYSVITKTQPTWQYGANVSGGVQALRYFLSGNYDSQIGALHLGSLARQSLEEQLGVATLSDAVRNPNTLQTLSGHANLSADVTPRMTVNLTAEYAQTAHRQIDASVSFANQYAYGAPTPGADTSSLLGVGINTYDYLTTTEEHDNRLSGAVNGTVQLFSWLTANATAGLDLDGGVTHTLLPQGWYDPSDGGYAQDDRRDNVNRTLTLGAVAMARPGPLSFRTSLGVQYTYGKLDGVSTIGQNLAPGSTSIGTAANVSVSQQWGETVTLGTYGEEVAGLNDRLFLTGSLRLDGATSFGDSYHPHPYPKVGVSWIASEEPWLKQVPGVRSLRFRYSYGAASRYPTSAMKLGSVYGYSQTLFDQAYTRFGRSGLANPLLRPERSRETEYGADATILSGVDIGLTWYRRRTSDQIGVLSNATGLPYNWANVGDVAAQGFEATVNVPLVRSRAVQADLAFTYAHNTDKLLSAGAAHQFISGASGGYVVGYPLDPVFGQRILSTVDTVGGHADSVVFSNEVVRDSVSRFLGVFNPPYTYTLTPTMTVFNGRVRLSALFDRQTGFLLYDNTAASCASGGLCLAPFLKSTPAMIQAKYLSYHPEDFFEPGDFTRLREVNITFDVSQRFLRVDPLHLRFSHASLSLQGRNLALWTAYKGSDPESHADRTIVGTNANGIPQARAWSFRFDLTP